MVDTAVPDHARTASPGAPPPGPTGADIDPIRPARSVAHHGYTVLVGRSDGSIEPPDEGLYDLDTRILSRYELRLDGERPRAVGSCAALGDRWTSTLAVRQPGGNATGPRLPQDTWAIHVERRVGCGMVETLRIRNHSMGSCTANLTIDLDADFADRLRAPAAAPEPTLETGWDADTARLTTHAERHYRDLTDRRGLAVTTDPPPTSVEPTDASAAAHRLTYELDLGPGEERTIELTFASYADGAWRTPSDADGRHALAETWSSRRTRISTSGALVGPATERAAEDLLALRAWELEPSTDGSEWVVNAGVPSFTGFFGRDAITAGWQSAMLGTEPLRGALRVAAQTQGERSDPWTEEQPGRMVHEMRRGPLAILGVRPHRAYYGSQTTGSMYVLGLSELWHWTGDDDLLREHLPYALRAIEWAETLGDSDDDGFLEYDRRSPDGLKNQAWKDSDEAIRYPDGRIVEDPISTVEEQAFHYIALQRMAEILVALDEPREQVDALLLRATALRSAWHGAFWLPDDGFYAIALDSDKRRVATIASNPGHALGVGIVTPEIAPTVADRLMAKDLFSGWGVRTLSSNHPSYNPFAYHLGAVWPVENATIALGFKRYGLDHHLDRLVEGLFSAIADCRDLRLPEALTGHDRRDLAMPLPYPDSQSPQAWSASATVQLLQVMLGIYPFAPAGVLGLIRPRLPAWLPTVTLRGLRVGGATVTIRFDRESDGTAAHTVLEQDGPLWVLEVPPPDAVNGGDGMLARLLGWVLDHAHGRTATALRIAMGDNRPLDRSNGHGQGPSR